LLYFLTHQQDFSLVPVQSRAQITHYAVHPADGKVHVHRDRCPDVFQHHIALDRFGLSTGTFAWGSLAWDPFAMSPSASELAGSTSLSMTTRGGSNETAYLFLAGFQPRWFRLPASPGGKPWPVPGHCPGRLLGCEEWLEGAAQGCTVHATTSVDYRQFHARQESLRFILSLSPAASLFHCPSENSRNFESRP
jgi:hypothetical protein